MCIFSILYFLFTKEGEKIRWDTFLEAMKQILKHQDFEKDALCAYAVFDPGRRGHFSIRRLRDALMMGCKATPLEMAEIYRMADPDLDGKVNEKGKYFTAVIKTLVYLGATSSVCKELSCIIIYRKYFRSFDWLRAKRGIVISAW